MYSIEYSIESIEIVWLRSRWGELRITQVMILISVEEKTRSESHKCTLLDMRLTQSTNALVWGRRRLTTDHIACNDNPSQWQQQSVESGEGEHHAHRCPPMTLLFVLPRRCVKWKKVPFALHSIYWFFLRIFEHFRSSRGAFYRPAMWDRSHKAMLVTDVTNTVF